MKVTIIYASIHHQNTKKIAQSIGSVLNAEPISFLEATKEDVLNSDLVGFGSGVYFSKFHKSLNKFVDELPKVENKKAFLFSTAGVRKNFILNRSHEDFRKRLEKKGFEVIGEFDCKGLDTNGFLKFFGGINKGKPDEKDIQNAKEFAKTLL